MPRIDPRPPGERSRGSVPDLATDDPTTVMLLGLGSGMVSGETPDSELLTLGGWLTGMFSSREQAAADPASMTFASGWNGSGRNGTMESESKA